MGNAFAYIHELKAKISSYGTLTAPSGISIKKNETTGDDAKLSVKPLNTALNPPGLFSFTNPVETAIHLIMSLTLSIVIPAYNEALRIESSVEKILSWIKNNPRQTEIIFVVEKSKDDTLQILQRITSGHPAIKIIPTNEHRGKGAAVKRGMLEAQNELHLMSDVDWSVPTDLIEVFCQRMEASDQPDICFGSRKHPKSNIVNPQPCYRQWIGILLNWKLRRDKLTESHDTQCGFKMFRKKVAHKLFSELEEEGFAFDIEILLRAKYADCKIIELPVTWYNDTRTTVNIREGFPKMLAAIKRFKKLQSTLKIK